MHMLSKIDATLSETLVVNVNKQQTNREQESYPGCKSYKSYLLICSDERTNGLTQLLMLALLMHLKHA